MENNRRNDVVVEGRCLLFRGHGAPCAVVGAAPRFRNRGATSLRPPRGGEGERAARRAGSTPSWYPRKIIIEKDQTLVVLQCTWDCDRKVRVHLTDDALNACSAGAPNAHACAYWHIGILAVRFTMLSRATPSALRRRSGAPVPLHFGPHGCATPCLVLLARP